MKDLKQSKLGGEQSAAVTRERYTDLRKWLLKMKNMRSACFPKWDWLPMGMPGMEEAREHWSADATKLAKEAAAKMLEKYDSFVEKDKWASPQALSAAPGSNDFVEGSHGTLGVVLSRLPGSNPARIAQIAQAKHNRGALKEMGVPLVPSEEQIASAKQSTSLPSAASQWSDVYRSQKVPQIRRMLQDTAVDEVRKQAAELGIDHTNMNKPELIEELVSVLYKPPSTPPPQKRARRSV